MAEGKVIRLNLNRGADRYERNKQLAGYAAGEGIIAHHHRGNITSFVNWCMEFAEDWLTKRARKERGF